MSEIHLDVATVSRRSDGIVTVRMRAIGTEVDEGHAERMIEAVRRLDEGRPPLLILDGDKVSLTFAAQRLLARSDCTCAVAVVARTNTTQAIAHALISLFSRIGGKYPMQYFSDAPAAEVWLRSLVVTEPRPVESRLSS